MIIILVQACEDAPYKEMMKAQMKTWDSIEHPDCKTIYYVSTDNFTAFQGNILRCQCSEAYNMMHWRNKLAMDVVCLEHEFDYIFRTNASSYVNKKELVAFSKSLPKEKCYCGIDGGGYASGAGVFMSPDVVDLVRYNTDHSPNQYEDAYMGAILGRQGIKVTPGAKRVEINHADYSNIPKYYHYRCKSDTGDRGKDIHAFYEIFKQYPFN